jgi:hypothetical protein
VREGPFIAENANIYVRALNEGKEPELKKYVPQTGFLALLMTGNGVAIGQKWGITFSGKWVWGMKDFIDRSFMKIFDPNYLFKDYKTQGCTEPVENNELFEEESKEEKSSMEVVRAEVALLEPGVAAQMIKDVETPEE